MHNHFYFFSYFDFNEKDFFVGKEISLISVDGSTNELLCYKTQTNGDFLKIAA